MSFRPLSALLPFISKFLLFSNLASADVSPFLNSQEYQDGSYGNYTIQTFITEPDFNIPVPNILVPPQNGASPSEYIMWTPVGLSRGMNGNGPMMLNATDLSLVYQAPEYSEPGVASWGSESIGGTVQTCNGTDYITWWAGKGHWGRKAGRYYVLDMNYNLVYNVSAVNLQYGDAHEFFLTPQCTAIFTVYQEQQHDLSIYNITDGYIIENWFQEVDLATNELLFEWRASDFVNITDTYLTPNISEQGTTAWNGMDYFHINSIEKDIKGNYLISSRHTRSLYYIDGKTGGIWWTLGGKRNQFTDLSGGNATNFAWQHHARWTSDNLTSLSLFDNRDSKYEYAPDYVSRGMILNLDYNTKTVELVAEYRAPNNITAIREGSMQLIPDTDNNVLLGWGNEPGFTEYTANGTIVWDVRFGPLNLDRESADNYRALKVNWTGVPTWAPKIAAGPTNVSLLLPLAQPLYPVNGSVITKDSAFFSWNGATAVAKWIVLASSDNTTSLNSTSDVWQEVAKSGFESSILVGSAARYIRAVAVARNATILGATEMLDMRTGNLTTSTFNTTLFNEEWKAQTQKWGSTAAAVEMMKQKWATTTSSTHFWSGLVGLVGLSSAVALVVLYVRRRSSSVRYRRLMGRKRSDTLDSKKDLEFEIRVVDHDKEMGYSSGEDSPSFSVEGDERSSHYRDFDGDLGDRRK